ncbi:hypothetical protein U1Q18_012319 [Sarracenia purpurea var. burkii]
MALERVPVEVRQSIQKMSQAELAEQMNDLPRMQEYEKGEAEKKGEAKKKRVFRGGFWFGGVMVMVISGAGDEEAGVGSVAGSPFFFSDVLQRNRWVKMGLAEAGSFRRFFFPITMGFGTGFCREGFHKGSVRTFNGDFVVEGFFNDSVGFSVLRRRREQR